MTFFHPALKNGRAWWDQSLFPATEFSQRLQRVRAMLRTEGAQALLAYGDAQCYGQLTYISHFLPKHRGGMVFVPLTGEPVLLIEAGKREIPSARSLGWIEDIRATPDGVGKVLADIVASLGPAPRLAVAGPRELMRTPEWEDFAARLDPNASLVDVSKQLYDMRRTKRPAELGAIVDAGRRFSVALEAAQAALVPGSSVEVLVAVAERELRRRGAEDVRTAVAVRPEAELLPPLREAIPANGCVRLCLGCASQRYWAIVGRTLWTYQVPAIGQEVIAAHGRALAALRPGLTLHETLSGLEGLLAPLRKPGTQGSFSIAGIGLDLSEPPGIHEADPVTLAPGMTLVLRTTVWPNGAESVFQADTVALTAAGADILTGS